MNIAFVILSILLLGGAFSAVLLRRLVHSVLCLVLAFCSQAAVYLLLGAQFLGFAQILVYVGAVAILVVFALLLTRNSETLPGEVVTAFSWRVGVVMAASVLGCLAICILGTPLPSVPHSTPSTVAGIGTQLMSQYILPLEALALLLTVVLIGAVILAMPEKGNKS